MASEDVIKVLVLGDSHTDVWKLVRWKIKKHHDIKVVIQRIPGTTANSLHKMKESYLQSGWKMSRILEDRSDVDWLVLSAGSVDLEFVYYAKAVDLYTKGETPKTLCEYASCCVTQYFEFIDNVIIPAFKRPERIILQGLHLPTLNDEQNELRLLDPTRLGSLGDIILKGGVLDKRILRPQVERTEAFLYFNARLKEEASQRGLSVIDITKDLLDPETDVIKQDIRRMGPLDIHVDEHKIVHLYINYMIQWDERFRS